MRTNYRGVDVLPSSMQLAGAEIEMVDVNRRESRLKAALAPLREKYDYLFIDCPPSLGLLTLNALCAADTLLVPIQCEYYALEGLSQLMATVRQVKRLYLSLIHILHLFRDELHKTINECVTECRIQAAKTMLSNPRYKMVEISQKVGYKNEKYFTRVFKKATDMNPSEYARRSR